MATMKLEPDIDRAAISGRSTSPRLGSNTPAAIGSATSLTLEGLQSFLPTRVASQLDWLANSGGALLGALPPAALSRLRGFGSR